MLLSLSWSLSGHSIEVLRSSYIAQWSKKEVGTGGSDFMPALTAYKVTTAAHRLGTGAAGA